MSIISKSRISKYRATIRRLRYWLVVVFCIAAIQAILHFPTKSMNQILTFWSTNSVDKLDHPPTTVLISAFLAVAVAYIAELFTDEISETDQMDIHDRINKQATKIAKKPYYYRPNASIRIGPIVNGKLKFVFDSFIVGIRETSIDRSVVGVISGGPMRIEALGL